MAVATQKPSDGLKIDAATNFFIILSPRIKYGLNAPLQQQKRNSNLFDRLERLIVFRRNHNERLFLFEVRTWPHLGCCV